MPAFDIACSLLRQAVAEDERYNYRNAITLYGDALDRLDEAMQDEVRDPRFRPRLVDHFLPYRLRYLELLEGTDEARQGLPPLLPPCAMYKLPPHLHDPLWHSAVASWSRPLNSKASCSSLASSYSSTSFASSSLSSTAPALIFTPTASIWSPITSFPAGSSTWSPSHSPSTSLTGNIWSFP